MKRGYVDTPEGQVHYRTGGSGEPLLLLHRVGLSSDEFTEMVPFLSRRCMAIALDFPGYGDSDMPEHELTVEDYARNVIDFLDGLDIEKTSIFGRLTGASVGVELAVAYPSRVNKLILSSCIFPEPEVRRQRLDYFRQRRLERMEINEDGSHLVRMWQERLQYPYQDLEMAQRNLIDNLKPALGRREDEGHIAVFSYDIEARLPALKCPTLLLYGAADKWLRRADALGHRIALSRVRIIEGTGMVPTWERPEEFAEAVADFLEAG